jgi:hypothetical protein
MSLALKNPDAKIALFLVFHIIQIVACQINKKPLLIFLFLADPFTSSKREERVGGITMEIPIQLNTAPHTFIAN